MLVAKGSQDMGDRRPEPEQKLYLGDRRPEPEQRGLFVTFCTEWILKKHIKTNMFAQQSQKKRKLHGPASIWEHKKNVKL